MLNILVETKYEYISHLLNILTPLIFEGLQSIYKEAQKISDATDVLKIFQTYLKRIPKWNKNLIDKETERIINSSHSYGWLGDLIKATLKSNLIVLMYNPTKKIQEKVDSSFYKNITPADFIHKVYIECARELWNNPYLLYHNYPPIEIKRNQRDCMNIIKDCIKEALRKLLPVKHILSIYLGEDIEENNNDDNFEKSISEADEKNLTKIISKDLSENKQLEYNIFEKINSENKSDSKTIGSKILNIIKPNEINNTQTDNDKTSIMVNNKDKEIDASTIINKEPSLIIDKPNYDTTSENIIIPDNNDPSSLTVSLDNETSELDSDIDKSIKNIEQKSKINNELDNKIKKILNNDLNDTDFETSITEQNKSKNKYHEIFSNSDNKVNQKLFKKYMEF